MWEWPDLEVEGGGRLKYFARSACRLDVCATKKRWSRLFSRGLVPSSKPKVFDPVAFSFIYDKYYLIIN